MLKYFALCSFIALVSASGTYLGNFASSSELERAIADFQGWFESAYLSEPQNKGRDLPVRLGITNTSRLGVFATRPIKKGEIYLAVPKSIIIDEETIFSTPYVGDTFRKLWNQHYNLFRSNFGIPQEALLALYLVQQDSAGLSSPFFNYIRLLPAVHETPAFYSNAELHYLRGTSVPSFTHDYVTRTQQQFNLLSPLMVTNYPKLFVRQTLTLERWRWAIGILSTRMIWWGGPHLVPMLDMVNCDEQGMPPHRTYGNNRVAETFAARDFAQAEQVVENYGQPNAHYLRYHGFVLENNRHDCAEIEPLPTVRGLTLKDNAMRRAKQLLGLRGNSLCVRPGSKRLLLEYVRIATAKNPETLRAAPQSPLSPDEERTAVRYMGFLLNHTLGAMATEEEVNFGYPSTDSLEEKLPFKQRMIRSFVLQQRAMLRELLADARRMAAKLREEAKKTMEEKIVKEDHIEKVRKIIVEEEVDEL